MEILGSKNFSNSFDKTDSKVIDLYDSVSSANLPSFWIIIYAIFHWDGKKPHLRHHIVGRWILFSFLIASTILDCLWSRNFFGFIVLIIVLTFLMVKDLISREIVSSENNLFSSSKVILRGLGLKTLKKRCVLNVSAFFSSFLAQLLSCFLIGEYCVYNRFSRLVVFQRVVGFRNS